MAKRKTHRKWNKDHKFMIKKKGTRLGGHPVYVYGRSGDQRKYLMFTHDCGEGPRRINYTKLKYNVDPNDNDHCYVNNHPKVSKKSSLENPDKAYRIHPSDYETIKKLKK